MKYHQWSKSFETGNAVIDAQHRELIDGVGDMADKMKDGHGADALAACKAFRKLFETHFRDEEEILEEAKFPRVKAHRESHADNLEQLQKVFDGCGEKCLNATSSPCIEELSHLVYEHLLRGDLDFKSHLQTKKLASD
ncbi:MAG: hemerythrin domain-containing protein [Rhodospirillales bacterium]|nr:hemerythrin domain-containing protein [Rhodospirillales bacterium]